MFATVAAGCNDSQTFRDALNQKNDSFEQAKSKEIQHAEGVYAGTMHMKESDEDFDFLLNIHRVSEFARTSDSQDQTETMEVQKLGAEAQFPVLDQIDEEDLPSYSELTTPMGSLLKIILNSGDYNPRKSDLVLTYADGELRGKFSPDSRYDGAWVYHSQIVGVFDLIRQEGGADAR